MCDYGYYGVTDIVMAEVSVKNTVKSFAIDDVSVEHFYGNQSLVI